MTEMTENSVFEVSAKLHAFWEIHVTSQKLTKWFNSVILVIGFVTKMTEMTELRGTGNI